MKILRPMLVGAIVFSAVMLGVNGARTAAAATPPNVLCSGSFSSPGILSSGTYGNVTVSGFCSIVGVVTVTGNINVAQGATLDAAFALPTLTVDHSIFVWDGAVLILGCSPEIGCKGSSSAVVKESVIGNKPLGMLVHNDVIGRNVSLAGGGGGFDCISSSGFFAFFKIPVYSTFEDNRISGNAVVSNYRACYFGFIRNRVHGDATFMSNSLGDPDAMEISSNIIRGSLACIGNSPAPHLPFEGGGSFNTVREFKTGQCRHL